MKPPKAHQVVPALVMTAASAIPVITATEMLAHTSNAGAAAGLTSTQPTISTPTATATPKAMATLGQTAPTKANATATATSTPQPVTQTYTGPVIYDREGAVQATITVTGKRITNVTISTPQNDQRSIDINSRAVPLLIQETLAAQNANINMVSGATDTSTAYQQSLQGALTQAHL